MTDLSRASAADLEEIRASMRRLAVAMAADPFQACGYSHREEDLPFLPFYAGQPNYYCPGGDAWWVVRDNDSTDHGPMWVREG